MSPKDTYEKSDVEAKPVVIFMIYMAVLCIFTFVVCAVIFRGFEKGFEFIDTKPHNMFNKQTPPDSPLLLIDEPANYQVALSKENTKLHGYGWLSKEAGIAHIPIEEAKALYLKKKLKK
ncbi:MAG: hypothetical protein ACI9Y8_001503 [Candidatus Omnitrophota bacterium]|jgi:hypothetical protein